MISTGMGQEGCSLRIIHVLSELCVYPLIDIVILHMVTFNKNHMKNPQCSKSAEKNDENDYIIRKFDHPLVLCHLSPECCFYGLPRNMCMLLFIRSTQHVD